MFEGLNITKKLKRQLRSAISMVLTVAMLVTGLPAELLGGAASVKATEDTVTLRVADASSEEVAVGTAAEGKYFTLTSGGEKDATADKKYILLADGESVYEVAGRIKLGGAGARLTEKSLVFTTSEEADEVELTVWAQSSKGDIDGVLGLYDEYGYLVLDEYITTPKSKGFGSSMDNPLAITFSKTLESGKTYYLGTPGRYELGLGDGDPAPQGTNLIRVEVTETIKGDGPDIASGTYMGMEWSISESGLLTVSGEYDVEAGGTGWSQYAQVITSAKVIATGVTSTSNWFDNCLNLESIDFSQFDTSQVTDMSNMFAYCESLTVLDLSSFDLSELKNAAGMFYDCRVLNRLYTPKNVKIDIYLPYRLQDAEGNSYSMLPRDMDTSIQLDKGEIIASGTVSGLEWTISGDGKLSIGGIYDPNKAWKEDWSDYLYAIISAEVNVTGLTWTNDWFNSCAFLEEVDLRGFDASQVTDMNCMFAYCWSLTSLDLSDKDTSQVTDMSDMFAECFKLTSLNLSNFKTGRVTNMSGMFAYCKSLTSLDLSSFDTSQVTDMSGMFDGCESLTSLDLSSFDTSGVQHMFSLSDCSSLEQLDTPKNLNTSESIALPFTMYDEDGNEYTQLPTGRETTVHLTSQRPGTGDIASGTYMGMEWTIDHEGNLTILGEYDSQGENNGWKQYAQQITTVKVAAAGVTNTANWFDGFTNLVSVDLSGFDTNNLTDASYMFRNCSSLTALDLSRLYLGNLVQADGMLDGCSALEELTAPAALETVVVLPHIMYSEQGVAYNLLSSSNIQMRLTKTLVPPTFHGMSWMIDENHLLTIWGEYDYAGTQLEEPEWLSYSDLISSVKVTATGVKSTYSWFKNLRFLEHADFSGFNASQLTDMSYMFAGCSSLKELNLSGFDLSNLGEGKSLNVLDGCSLLEQLDTPFNLSWGIDLPYTMYDETGTAYNALPIGQTFSIHLTRQQPEIGPIIFSGNYMGMDWTISERGLLIISGEYNAKAKGTSWTKYAKYIVSAKVTATGVTSTSGWFNKCTCLENVDLRWFDTSIVTDMSQMFSNCTNLVEVRFGSYNTGNLTDLSQMFYGCSNLEFLDLSSFNTKNVTKVSQMFAKCQRLIELDLSNFDMANCSTAGSMLTGCNALEILYTPRNLKVSVALPCVMYDGGGTAYKALPTGLEESIFLTRELLPTTFRGMTWSIDGNGVLNIEGAYDYNGTEQEKPGWYGSSYTGVNVTATGVKSTYYWFADSGLKGMDFNRFDTSALTDVSYMFSGCDSLKSLDMSSFDMSKVEKAEGMLDGCTALTRVNTPRNLTQTVKLPRILFYEGTEYTELPTGQSESILLTDMVSGTFRGMNWTIDEGRLTVTGVYQGSSSTEDPTWLKYADYITSAEVTASGVTDAGRWFYNCSALASVDLSGFDFSQITDMSRMFDGCKSLTAIKFKIYQNSSLKSISRMFAGCAGLTTVDLSGFDLSNLEAADSVFENCTSLKTINAPKNLKLEIVLPVIMYDEAGEEYEALPMNKGKSILLSDRKPATLAIEPIPDQTYTGKAIKPEVVVTFGSRTLVKGKDYTLSYKNNKKIAAQKDAKAPTVTIKGKGSYTGSVTETFNIVPIEMTEENTRVSSMAYPYTSKTQTPAPTVTVNGKTLKANRDFVVERAEDDSGDAGDVFKEPGTYGVVIRGIGNYQGEIPGEVLILESGQIPASRLSISGVTSRKFDGEAVTFDPEKIKVTYNGKKLEEGADYELSYRDNDRVGKAALIVTGLGNTDEGGVCVYGSTEKTFNITGTALSKVTFRYVGENAEGDEILKSSYSTEYTGEEIIPAFRLYTREKNPDYVRGEDDPEDQWFTTELEEGADYTVVYTNNVKKGKATMTFTGCGRFSGTLKKTFTIKAVSIPTDEVEDRVSIEFVDVDSVPYSKSGAKPTVIVKVDGVELEIGKDCTVSYSNNKKIADADAAKAPTVTVKGKGSYSFKKSKTATFSIVNKDLSDEDIIITAPDKIIGAKGSLLSTPVVTDGNGKKLKVKTDYTIIGYEMKGEEFKGTETVTAGDTVTIKLSGNGNYEGEKQVVYRFAEKDISKAKVQITKMEYTGGEIEFTEKMIEEGKFKVYIPKKGENPQQDLRYGTDYIITGYKNNIKKGTATVTIQGINGYGGTKAVKFKITARKFKKE